MWSLEQIIGTGGLDKLVFGNESSKVELYLFGGTITSWNVNGIEKLFVSSQAIYNGIKAIRGGIPIVFPQFSQPLKELNQHGFARTSIFKLESINSSHEDAMVVTLSLTDNDNTRAVWLFPFRLEYEVTLTVKSLSSKLTVINTGPTAFQCHTLLHSYLSITSIHDISVTGFQGCSYIDKVTNNTQVEKASASPITQEVDRIILPSSTPITPVTIIDHTSSSSQALLTLNLSATLDDQPYPFDVVFWNPWIEKAKTLADLGDEDYLRYVCVEPGTVSNWVDVQPNSILILQQTLNAC